MICSLQYVFCFASNEILLSVFIYRQLEVFQTLKKKNLYLKIVVLLMPKALLNFAKYFHL